MIVYFVRHAEAEKTSPDFQRNLSAAGIRGFEQNLSIWKSASPKIDLIISSPLVRAVQTAELIKNHFSMREEPAVSDKLAPGSRLGGIIELLRETDCDGVVLVGHLPDFANHISDLVSTSGMRIGFSPGAIACVDFDGAVRMGSGELKYLIQSV